MFVSHLEFYLLFVTVLSAMFFLKSTLLKKLVLLSSSLCFYAYFDYKMLLLLVLSSLLTFCISLRIYSAKGTNERKVFLVVGVCLNLLNLIFFKYFNFFIDVIVEAFHLDPVSGLYFNVIIPLGVSFYTFRFISYVIDIYRRETIPCNMLDFLIYSTFFPVLVAGPITREKYFVPQLTEIKLSSVNFYEGYRLFVIGLFLKIFIADRLAYFVNFFFENSGIFNCITAWLAVLAYSVQIYCDFAGYSSMAIGLALMLGFQIEENFNFPYLAESMIDFWRRWHMTLSSWIKDYLYIPLGGSKKEPSRKYMNLLFSMTVCGLWHGAAWTFVLWGFLHGVLLIINHTWRGTNYDSVFQRIPRCYTFISWLITFLSVTLCWIVFRAYDVQQAIDILQTLFSFSSEGVLWPEPFVIFIILATCCMHILVYIDIKFVTLPVSSPFTTTILFCLIWLVIVFYPTSFQPFVYSQF